jgi:hypothetical protein
LSSAIGYWLSVFADRRLAPQHRLPFVICHLLFGDGGEYAPYPADSPFAIIGYLLFVIVIREAIPHHPTS